MSELGQTNPSSHIFLEDSARCRNMPLSFSRKEEGGRKTRRGGRKRRRGGRGGRGGEDDRDGEEQKDLLMTPLNSYTRGEGER